MRIARAAVRSLQYLPESWLLRLAGGSPITIEGRTLDPILGLVAARAAGQPPLETLDPIEARAATTAGLALLDGPLRRLELIEDRRIPGPAAEIPVRVYHPLGVDGPRPLLLYFHQGGCVIGDLDWCDSFCSILADTARCVVVSVDYRLAPEHPFPAAVDDAWAAFGWARAHAGEVGGDPARVAVGGDSAGGLLAAVIAQTARTAGEPQPVVQLLVYPWLLARGDTASYAAFGETYPLTRSLMCWFGDHYLGPAGSPEADAAARDVRASPLLADDLSGLAPAIVATAGFDPLSDEGHHYAEKLEAAGVPVTYRCYDTLSHSFTSMSGAVPAARNALYEIARDLERVLSG